MKTRAAMVLAVICAAGAGHSVLSSAMAAGPYKDASGSMLPIVGKDDLIHCVQDGADKLAYGDLVIYRLPADNKTLWIKMVVGFAGDTIQMKDGALWINGKAVPKHAAGEFKLPGPGNNTVTRYEETLPGSVKTFVLDMIPKGLLDNTAPYSVPADHIFVIGSNRDDSVDSRMLHNHGPVPEGNVVCKGGL